MDILTLAFWVVTLIWLVFSLKKDKTKTWQSIQASGSMMKGMVGQIIGILFLIGLILTFIPPEVIREYMGQANLALATALSALAGSITLIPAFVAFPLCGSLLKAGANITPVVAFLTTLTMVGIVTFPLEKREFGVRFTAVRNALSFAFAIGIALLMGVLV